MKAFERKTRLKLSNNPTGELVKIVTLCVKQKIARQLRAFRAASSLILAFLALSCSTDEVDVPPICVDGDCSAQFIVNYPQDINGYFHVDLNFDGQYYPRFNIELDADATHEAWRYNDRPVVVAAFDTDTYWQFQNDYLPVVQGTNIYLSLQSSGRMYGKRIVGPIPPEMVGDTITIYPQIMWDAGNAYQVKDFSLKFIIE